MNDHDEWESEEDFDDWFDDLWEADVEPPRYVIKDLVPTGLTFMVAPPKSYKSTVEMAMSLAVAGEKSTAMPAELLEVPEPGIVLGLSAEASPGELRYMVEQGMGAKPGVHGMIRLLKDPWRFRLDDEGAANTLLRLLNSRRPRLLWIDPLRDFHSLDEVDAGEMNRLLRPLQRWAKVNDAAVLIVHHTRKRQGGDDERNLKADDARGTSALFGMCDGLIVLTPKGKNRVHFDVTLKRGQSWEKTVQLSVWGDGEARVMIDGYARQLYEALLQGKRLEGVSESTVKKAMSQLRSLGALDAAGKADPTKAALVLSSVRTLAKEG